MRVILEAPASADEGEFLDAVARSKSLYRFGGPPNHSEGFRGIVRRTQDPRYAMRFVRLGGTRELVGFLSASEIVRGVFQSCYFGYTAFEPLSGHGFMREACAHFVDELFGELGLHRIEANIQPENAASLALARGLGFRWEGRSRRYLKIGGAWRDHDRFALLVDEWPGAELALTQGKP